MKCPNCKHREHVEIDLHADGYAQDARECGDCGCVWTFKNTNLIIIRQGNKNEEVLRHELSTTRAI
jgi:transcriptional regulator NrdR family protein